MNKKDTTNRQIEELNHQWKRALADYQNLQRRYEAEKTDFIAFASSNLILKLLTVLDHLKLARQKINDQGLTVAIVEFDRILQEEGLEEISAQGQPFDPATMEAVETVDGEKDKVVSVIAEGYTLKGKLLRPARVRVGKGVIS